MAAPHYLVVNLRAFIGCLALLGVSHSADAQIPSPDSLKQVLKRTTYVFEGVVQKWKAVADPALRATDETGVVRVTRAFACPQAVGEFGGENVTVHYTNPSAVPAGSRAWFLGTGWVVGDHIATSALSVIPVANDRESTTILGNLRQAIRLGARDALQAAAEAADFVVLATVKSIDSRSKYAGLLSLVQPGDTMGRVEHAERWSVVQIAVDSVRGRRDTSSNGSGKFAGTWLAPLDSMRNITILVPATDGYSPAGVTQLLPGVQRLLLLDRARRRPNLRNVDSTAVAFIPNATGIRPVSDGALLGDVLPNPGFTMSPVHECAEPLR